MSLARQDRFVESLKNMQSKYPEYSQILKFLIEQVQQGKVAAVQAKLQQLREEDW
jgi:hypothetical protein